MHHERRIVVRSVPFSLSWYISQSPSVVFTRLFASVGVEMRPLDLYRLLPFTNVIEPEYYVKVTYPDQKCFFFSVLLWPKCNYLGLQVYRIRELNSYLREASLDDFFLLSISFGKVHKVELPHSKKFPRHHEIGFIIKESSLPVKKKPFFLYIY